MFRRTALLSIALLAAGCGGGPSGPQTVDGALEAGDSTLGSGEFYDMTTVRLQEGQWLTVRIESQRFDPYVVVRDPSGQQSEMDDSTPGDTTAVELSLRAQAAGAFQVLVTSYAPGATGAYRMTYEVTAEAPPGASPSAAGAEAPGDEPPGDEAPGAPLDADPAPDAGGEPAPSDGDKATDV